MAGLPAGPDFSGVVPPVMMTVPAAEGLAELAEDVI